MHVHKFVLQELNDTQNLMMARPYRIKNNIWPKIVSKLQLIDRRLATKQKGAVKQKKNFENAKTKQFEKVD